MAQTGEPTPRKPLRLWPGVVAAVLLVVVRFIVPIVVPGAVPFGMLGRISSARLLILAWWLFFSRAPWSERVGVLGLMTVAIFVTLRRSPVHRDWDDGDCCSPSSPSRSCASRFGRMGGGLRRLSDGLRRASMVATILAVAAEWRSSDGRNHRRASERLPLAVVDDSRATDPGRIGRSTRGARRLPNSGGNSQESPVGPDHQRAGQPRAPTVAVVPKTPAIVKILATGPAFADPTVTASSEAHESKQTGRRRRRSNSGERPIGPGWSSFAVHGDLILHPRAARSRRDRRVLPPGDRGAGLETPRPARF